MIEMDKENEKDYKFFKIILLLAQSFIIGICVIFFIGVTKVDALQQRVNLDTNGFVNNWETTYLETDYTYSNNTYLLDNRTWLQYKDFAMSGTNKYNLDFKLIVTYNKTRSSNVIGNLYLTLYNGSNLVSMGHKCTKSVTSQSLIISKIYIYDVHCVAVSGDGYYPYINVQVYADEIQQKTTKVSMSEWSFYVSQTSTDTDSINSNNDKNTETIINNNNTNTETIINNQNENTNKEIESQQVCDLYDKSKIVEDGYYFNSGGSKVAYSEYGLTDYIDVYNATLTSINNASDRGYFCFYTESKTKISCIANTSLTNSYEVTIPSNAKYVRFSINKTTNLPQFKICRNGNQALNDSVNDLNDTLNDSSIDDPSNALNGMHNYFGQNGVISDLLLLPVRMFQSIVSSIDGTCSPFNLGTLFNHQLTMPCINLSNRIGSALYGVIDVLISGFFILSIRKKFVDIFENFTSLKTGGNELE